MVSGQVAFLAARLQQLALGIVRALHRRAAVYLEQSLGASSDEHAALLARHWIGADEPEPALDWSWRAAQRATRLNAETEAAAHHWRALDFLDRLPATPARSRLRVELVLASFTSSAGFAFAYGRGLPAGLEQINRAIGSALEDSDLAAAAKLEAQRAYLSSDESFFTNAFAHAEESGDLLARAFVAGRCAAALGGMGQ